MDTEPTFTPEQLRNFRAYERVQKRGTHNMLDPRAQSATGLIGESDNPYIYDPRAQSATAFVTPRSLDYQRLQSYDLWLRIGESDRAEAEAHKKLGDSLNGN